MSNIFYAVAGCTYFAANWLVLKVLLTEWRSGNRWLVPVNLFANPVQTKRFIAFGALLLITFLTVIAADKLEH